jgi:Ferric reductase like transmembrane component
LLCRNKKSKGVMNRTSTGQGMLQKMNPVHRSKSHPHHQFDRNSDPRGSESEVGERFYSPKRWHHLKPIMAISTDSLTPRQGFMRKAAARHGEHLGRTLVVRGLFWFGFYLVLILFPLLVGWLRHPPEVEGRAFSLQFSVACGYVGLSVMAFEFVLISRVRVVSSAFGQDVLLKFHRQMGVVAAVLIAAHAVMIFRNGYPVSWLNPIGDGIVKWGVLAAYALIRASG